LGKGKGGTVKETNRADCLICTLFNAYRLQILLSFIFVWRALVQLNSEMQETVKEERATHFQEMAEKF
jgi:hypothetical protein